MRRVLYISRARLSFSRAHSLNIVKTAEGLQKTGNISIAVFSSAPEPKTKEEVFFDKGVRVPFALDISQRRRSLVWYLIRERNSYDIILFRDPFIVHAIFLTKILGKKNIFEVHGNKEWNFSLFLWKLSVFLADGALFITEGLRVFYNTKKPARVIPAGGFDKTLFLRLAAKEDMRRRLTIAKSASVIVYVGSFLWYSVDILIRMMKLLPNNAILCIVGAKEKEIEMIKERALREGVLEQIRIVGRVPSKEVPQYLALADILVNPLKIDYEGSISSKLYEYLAAARPIVSTRGGANAELLKDRQNALLVDATGEAFAEACSRIFEDKDLARSLGENAGRLAERYTWEARANIILDLVNEL